MYVAWQEGEAVRLEPVEQPGWTEPGTDWYGAGWNGGVTGLVRLEPVERPGWTEPGAGEYGAGWKGGVAGLVRLEPVERPG